MLRPPLFPRTAAFAGLAFALLFFLGIFFLPDLPEAGDTDEDVRQVYADEGSRTRIIAGSFSIAIGGALFLWFLANHRELLLAAGAAPALATVALASGVVYATLTLTAASALHFLAVGIAVGELPPVVDAALARAFTQLGFQMLLVPAMICAVPLVLATAAAAWRSAVLPRWWAWFSFPIALLLLLGIAYMPQLALPLWVAVLSGHLLVRGGAPAAKSGAS